MAPALAVVDALERYATFRGTASRSQFWWFALWATTPWLITTFLSQLIGLRDVPDWMSAATGIGLLLFSIVTFVPLLAAGARRLRDAGLAPLLLLLLLVPCLGLLPLLAMWAIPPRQVHYDTVGSVETTPAEMTHRPKEDPVGLMLWVAVIVMGLVFPLFKLTV